MALTQTEWQAGASRLIRTKIFEKDLSYKELARRLEKIGVEYDARALSNRVNRGTFSCVFFLQCMAVLNIKNIEIPKELLEKE